MFVWSLPLSMFSVFVISLVSSFLPSSFLPLLSVRFPSLLPCSGEDKAVDHLVFVVHGVELGTDLGFKRLVDCGKLGTGL